MWIKPDIDKDIQILKLGLANQGVKSKYFIGRKGDVDDLSERLCLAEQEDGTWLVYYSERGMRNTFGSFKFYYDAFKYFYWVLSDASTPWKNQ